MSGHDDAAGELVPAKATRHHRSHRHSPDSSHSRCRPSPDHTPTRRSRQHRSRLTTPSPHTHRTTPDTPNLAGSHQRPTATRDQTNRQQLRRHWRSPRRSLSDTIRQRHGYDTPNGRPGIVALTHGRRLARRRTRTDLLRRTHNHAHNTIDQHQTPAAITTQRVAAIPNERVGQH